MCAVFLLANARFKEYLLDYAAHISLCEWRSFFVDEKVAVFVGVVDGDIIQ